MLKVFLKIPGVSRPHAVVGRFVFEDERYLVIMQDIIRRKILWENILYVEEIPSVGGDYSDTNLPPANDDAPPAPTRNPPVRSTPVNPDTSEKVSITVAFTGAVNKLFTIENADSRLLSASKWTPDLAKLVFTNAEVKTILGSCVIKDIVLDGHNITLITEHERREKDAAMADIQSKVDLVNQLASAATKFGGPRGGRGSMRLPTDFSMSASPFERPIPLTDTSDISEDVDVSYRKEEDNSEG